MTLKERAEQMEAELLRDGATQILNHLEAVVREAADQAELVTVGTVRSTDALKVTDQVKAVILDHFGLTDSTGA